MFDVARDRSGRAGGGDDPLDGESVSAAFLPSMWQKVSDAIGGLVRNAEQDIGEVELGIDVVSHARRDERGQGHEAPACFVVAERERILPHEGDDSWRRLGGVVVYGDERVLEKRDEARPLVAHVTKRLAHCTAWFEERRHLLAPLLEAFDDRRAAPFSQREMLGSADDVPALRLSLDHEELENQVEPIARFRSLRQRLK